MLAKGDHSPASLMGQKSKAKAIGERWCLRGKKKGFQSNVLTTVFVGIWG